MKKMLVRSVASLALAAAIFSAEVAEATDGWYGRAEAGYSFDGELDFASPAPDANFDAGWLVDGGLGYAWGKEANVGTRLEGELSYRDNDIENSTSSVSALAGMLNGYLDFNRQGAIQPYLGLGVGYGKVKIDSASSVDDSGMGYQGMAGLGFRLSPQLTLDVGYKYFTIPELSYTITTITGTTAVVVTTTKYDFDYVNQAATVGLRWQFAAPAAPPPLPVQSPPPPPVCPAQDFKVYFEWDRSNLNQAALDTINAAAERAKACNVATVQVIGHTDTSGSKTYNVGLSNRRAAVVRDALVAAGISAASISTQGLGETQLDKQTRDGVKEPLNRRTAVTISFQ